MKKCFECGNKADEEHHIVPRSMGGTKTVPLCSMCHMKVHGLDKTRRAESAPELTKRGLDRIRVWELFAVHQSIITYEADTIEEIRETLATEFNLEYPKNKIQRLKLRIKEMDELYLAHLFETHIGEDLSYTWNEQLSQLRNKITLDVISEYILSGKINTESQLTVELFSYLQTEITDKFIFIKRDNHALSDLQSDFTRID